MTILYGIKNCDTMKKAFTWLDTHNIAYQFHDYKKQGVPADIITRAIADLGWETLINTRGTTWRALPDDVKSGMNATNALAAALENPSLIKRPLLDNSGKLYVGFTPDTYAQMWV